MSAAATALVQQQPTTEDKILAATAEALSVASIFSPAIAQVGAQGLSLEPSVSALVHNIISIFHKHTGVTAQTTVTAKGK